MNTPVSHTFKSGKRQRVETPEGLLTSPELVNVVKEVNDSTGIPECVKRLLLAITSQLSAVLSENASLRSQLEDIAKENERLKQQLRSYEDNPRVVNVPPAVVPPSNPQMENASYSEVERRRSVVIGNIPECRSEFLRDRRQYDFESVVNILSHLDVDCFPVTVYRMGRYVPGKNRLIKAVLPCSMFQRLAVQRAPLLSSFPGRGAFLRRSLTYEERKERREARQIFVSSSNLLSHAPRSLNQKEGSPRNPIVGSNTTASREVQGN